VTRTARSRRDLLSAWFGAALTGLCLVFPAETVFADSVASAGHVGDDCQSDAAHDLTLENRSLAVSIQPALASQPKRKFVAIEVAEVRNPQRIRATFDVYHRTSDQTQTLLGTFALFPPDNPARFIVATKGMVERIGEIVVVMNVLDEVASTDDLWVTVKCIYFADG
jgi:hypothetical protein